VQEHELGVLLIDPAKRWKVLENVMGSMGEDFFPEGKQSETWSKRDKIV